MNVNFSLTIASTAIQQDDEGRFSLKDLHKAAVASGITKDIRPNEWLARSKTKELAEILITEKSGNSPIHSTAGRYGDTFVQKELVYDYAMWISPAFSLKVIRAYDALILDQPQTQALPVMLTPAQYEAERDRIKAQQAALMATPIAVSAEQYEQLTGERIRVGKRTYLTTELVGVLEDCGVPRDAIKQVLGADANYVRQYAFRARKVKP